ncbi:hypothetical protein BLNAU_24035 [Blattamonas nauphoetae]|uniref:Uncharacterized protein n=1 Tax=Blattamonas nauphoetae TaxID=2049346 RepID=A0ABQ9WNK8_9EUKA|nr:hypothetical protein BLNAU_24035 [Blattamonas nauphoetae]
MSRLERQLADLRSHQIQPSSQPAPQPPLQPTPHSSQARSSATLTSSPARQGTVIRTQIGAAAIELLIPSNWTVSRNIFTKSQSSRSSLLSFEFGAVVARLSVTIRNGPNSLFTVGIISSNLSSKALSDFFPNLKGGAGWNLCSDYRNAKQNKQSHTGSACKAGAVGQRVVLEADGREGRRTLKLSQDGKTQPVFFTNIPVPFRFAVCVFEKNDAIEIESVAVVSEPLIIERTISVPMDE